MRVLDQHHEWTQDFSNTGTSGHITQHNIYREKAHVHTDWNVYSDVLNSPSSSSGMPMSPLPVAAPESIAGSGTQERGYSLYGCATSSAINSLQSSDDSEPPFSVSKLLTHVLKCVWKPLFWDAASVLVLTNFLCNGWENLGDKFDDAGVP